MPRRDGTGPMGKGMGTGRGMGYCRRTFSTYNKPLFTENNETERNNLAELEKKVSSLEEKLNAILEKMN